MSIRVAAPPLSPVGPMTHLSSDQACLATQEYTHVSFQSVSNTDESEGTGHSAGSSPGAPRSWDTLHAPARGDGSSNSASAYTVTSIADDGTLGTLRYGLESTTANKINFDSSTYGQTITLGDELLITRDVKILGPGRLN